MSSHWVYEINKFCDYLQPLHYSGMPAVRQSLRASIAKSDVVILSYDVLRTETDFFAQIQFNYVVLDEGHIIKVRYVQAAIVCCPRCHYFV